MEEKPGKEAKGVFWWVTSFGILRCVFLWERGHVLRMRTSGQHVFVRQQRVCLSVMYATVRVFQALNQMICGFFSPCEFKAGPCFWLWGRGCSCAMEKKEAIFLLGGLLGKTAALPTAASLQRALKECSPLLKSFPAAKQATSSQEHLTCRSPSNLTAAVRVKLRSMGNVQSRSPQSTHTL